MNSASRSIRPMGYGAIARLRNLGFATILGAGVAATPALAEPVTIVALGDSLTHGYGLPPEDGFVPQLERWLTENGADVNLINAGVSGDTTAGGLARIDWALTEETDAIIIALGANDLLRGLPPEAARRNLSGMLDEAQARALPTLIVGITAPGNYGADYKSAFDAIYPDLSQEYGTLYYENFIAPVMEATANGASPASLVQPDGLHPSAEGVEIIVRAMGPKVLELVERAKGE